MSRVIEIIAALVVLVVLAPLEIVIAVAVRLSSPGPAIFRQERVGRGGRPFSMLKFRTMRLHDSGPGVTSSGDSRVTGVGRVLRRLKLDELPELWNVVRGDLSLVGHRPEVPRYVEIDNPVWQRVLVERPGITHPVTLRLKDEEGLIASAGGDAERFYVEELLPFKLRGYVEYQERRTGWSDLKVLVATATALFGVRAYSPITLEEVRGTGAGL